MKDLEKSTTTVLGHFSGCLKTFLLMISGLWCNSLRLFRSSDLQKGEKSCSLLISVLSSHTWPFSPQRFVEPLAKEDVQDVEANHARERHRPFETTWKLGHIPQQLHCDINVHSQPRGEECNPVQHPSEKIAPTATHFHRRSKFPDFPEVEKHRMNLQTNKQKHPTMGWYVLELQKINRDSTYLLHFMLL